MKTKFWMNPFVIMGLMALLMSSCTKNNEETSTLTIIYNGNNNTDGSVPIDENIYKEGAKVLVMGNPGSLIKTAYSLSGWNTTSDGTGENYVSGSSFNISNTNVILYAKWIIGGKLTVKILNATNFNDHSIYYSIYDTNAIDPVTGAPSGNKPAHAQLNILNNEGVVVTGISGSTPTGKVFDNGIYYLSGMVDMNDNAANMAYAPDTGDKYGDFINVVINGDSDLTLTEEDFPYFIP